jgi:hypothetical protein
VSTIRTINAQGHRGTEETSIKAETGITRILAYGDSYTFGFEVSDDECWVSKLDASPLPIEVVNCGIGGCGVDQAFLRYQTEGKIFNPHIVFIGILPDNIRRHVNVFRLFLTHTGLPASKPRFILEGDQLKLLKNPLAAIRDYQELLINENEVLARLGQHDYFYQQNFHQGKLDILPSVRFMKLFLQTLINNLSNTAIMKSGQYNPNSEAFKITEKILSQFYKAVLSDNAIPIILIFPSRGHFKHIQSNKPVDYLSLVKSLKTQRLRYIDMMKAFENFGRSHDSSDFFRDMHYSPLGNEIVAKYLENYLKEEELIGSEEGKK